MKRGKYILLALALVMIFYRGNAQLETNLARVNITNKLLTRADYYEFDLRLIRTHVNMWDRWADGTFQFNLTTSDTNGINYKNLSIELVKDPYGNGITDLSPLLAGPGDMRQQLPTTEYHITPEVIPNTYVNDQESARISITIAGPDSYTDAVDVPYVTDNEEGILLGRFRVYSNDGSDLPKDLDINWLQPLNYYQACAYKRSKDDDNPKWHNFDPNIEMSDFNLGTTVIYDKDNNVDTCFVVKNFKAVYEGNSLVTLSWDTDCEVQNEGFVIKRGLMPYGKDDMSAIEYNFTSGDYRRSQYERDVLTGLGTAKPGKGYIYEYDTVDLKGEQYCYKLFNVDVNGDVHERAVTCVYIPNTVISFAAAIPTVFSDKTLIKYRLEEDVLLTVFVTDLNGKKVQTIYDKEPKDRGWYTDLYFKPNALAQQGLYEVIFIAKPRHDSDVEIARAVVKTQYVK